MATCSNWQCFNFSFHPHNLTWINISQSGFDDIVSSHYNKAGQSPAANSMNELKRKGCLKTKLLHE